ncbi:MAG: translation initiation factor IF-3 [Candidatus Delongbacteria bacterium]|nr:translation initiation factor IF-3 [Candidatus Delongbacteria bacterium]MCG2761215.1 translation initiation factor IF-3 [Candidatus Delongbacteria bacterium]
MITYEKVRLIDENGAQVGIISSKEANEMAAAKSLDLVEIAPNAKPPVCKIIDYGKYRYELQKKEKENKKKQHTVSLKTIRIMSVNIDNHDIEIKSKKAREFLEEGNKVKVFLQFRGREIAHKDMGLQLLKAFFGFLEDIAKMDKNIEQEGIRRISMILTKK